LQENSAEMAREAHSKATRKLEKSLEKGIFAFRVQMLLEENEALLKDEKYNEVVSNTDVISDILTREQSLTEMDEIQALLSQIKNLVIAANVENEDTSEIKLNTLKVTIDIQAGNLFKAKKVLVEILEGSEDLQRNHILRWSRYTIMELNQKMENILALYKQFPTQFFEFEENPVHILTSYLEDIISASRDERFDSLEMSVLNFYLFYYQVERFLKEEKQLKGGHRTLSISKIKVDEKELLPIEEYETPDEEGPDGVELLIPGERLKELYKELIQIERADSFFAAEISPVESEPEDDVFEEIDEDYDEDEEISSDESLAIVDEFTDEKPPKPDLIPEKLKREKMEGKPAKVQMLIKRKDKEEGKTLPGFQTMDEKKESAGKDQIEHEEVETTADGSEAEKEDEGIKAPVDMIHTEDMEEMEEVLGEEDVFEIDSILIKLDALAVKCMVNRDYELAIEYYDKIIMLDPNFKNAYAKRDECYLHTFENMKEPFRELTEKAVSQDSDRQKTKKSSTRRGKRQRRDRKEAFSLFSD